jgi:DHA1 family bicyclomycin/chloramphenicol resistance-like MFS transporter
MAFPAPQGDGSAAALTNLQTLHARARFDSHSAPCEWDRPTRGTPALSHASHSSGHRAGFEFIALMAVMTSIIAFSIDAMLPALPQIVADLGVADVNDRQLVVIVLFIGLALAQIAYGPMSDTLGRKPAAYVGFAIFIAGSLLCVFAGSFEIMLVGRFLQGVGAAGPRIVSLALVRDLYSGRAMARVMSMIMGIFIIVPVIAPSVGQVLLFIGDWRLIFVALLAEGIIGLVWFAWRQPETLKEDRRAAFSLRRIVSAFGEACGNPVTLGYTVAAGLVFGAFVGYLASTQQVLGELYGLGAQFPIYFGANALAFGAASMLNARLVMKLGMRRLAGGGLGASSALSVVFFIVTLLLEGHPPLWALMGYLLLIFFFVGVLFGNFNALAMEPMGHIAGVAAAVVGSLATIISSVLGWALGQAYDGTVRPMIAGFAVLTILAGLAMILAERYRRHP